MKPIIQTVLFLIGISLFVIAGKDLYEYFLGYNTNVLFIVELIILGVALIILAPLIFNKRIINNPIKQSVLIYSTIFPFLGILLIHIYLSGSKSSWVYYLFFAWFLIKFAAEVYKLIKLKN